MDRITFFKYIYFFTINRYVKHVIWSKRLCNCLLRRRYDFYMKFSSLGNPIVPNHFLGPVVYLSWAGLKESIAHAYTGLFLQAVSSGENLPMKDMKDKCIYIRTYRNGGHALIRNDSQASTNTKARRTTIDLVNR